MSDVIANNLTAEQRAAVCQVIGVLSVLAEEAAHLPLRVHYRAHARSLVDAFGLQHLREFSTSVNACYEDEVTS